MSRRIGEDFDEFVKFLSKYSLTSYASAPQQIEACKGMHKKLFGLLVFNAEFKIQGSYPNSAVFLDEMASDLLLSLFCITQGMYGSPLIFPRRTCPANVKATEAKATRPTRLLPFRCGINSSTTRPYAVGCPRPRESSCASARRASQGTGTIPPPSCASGC